MLVFRTMILLAFVAFVHGLYFGGEDEKKGLWYYFKGLFGKDKKKDLLPQTPGQVPGVSPGLPGLPGVGFGGGGQPRVAPVHHHHHHHHHHYKEAYYATPVIHPKPPIYGWK